MQTDTWLTETAYPENCPLCSQPLAHDSNTCSACGFTAHERAHLGEGRARKGIQIPTYKHPNPLTPIPARASAQRSQRTPEVPVHEEENSSGTRATGWQHNSSKYEAFSSLSSLSLILSETPTAPPRSGPLAVSQTEGMASIDEIDTVPVVPPHPASVSADQIEEAVHIDEIVTVPSSLSLEENANTMAELFEPSVVAGSLSLRLDENDMPDRALVAPISDSSDLLYDVSEIPTLPEHEEISPLAEENRIPSPALPSDRLARRTRSVNAASWSANPVSTTSASHLAVQVLRSGHRYPGNFRFTDRLRWWLLRPGHIEFSFWLAGSFLLFAVTFFLLAATVLSIMFPGVRPGGNSLSSAIHTVPTIAVSPSASGTPTVSQLVLSGKNKLLPGAELHLQGQGFLPRSRVTFWLDGRWTLLDKLGKPASAQSDVSGNFSLDLWLGQGANWSAGPHRIVVPESGSSRQTSISITILAPTPVPTNSPGTSAPPAAPVAPTTVPTTAPPPVVSPTAPPVADPTPVVTPTAESTNTPVPVTPTVAVSPPASGDADPSNLGETLSVDNHALLFPQLTSFDPLVWLIVLGYLLSMLFLGIAGVLYLRRR